MAELILVMDRVETSVCQLVQSMTLNEMHARDVKLVSGDALSRQSSNCH